MKSEIRRNFIGFRRFFMFLFLWYLGGRVGNMGFYCDVYGFYRFFGLS